MRTKTSSSVLAVLVSLLAGLALAGPALATPTDLRVDVEMLLDNGYGLAPGIYTDAGQVTLDLPDAAPAGFSGAALLSLDLVLGGDTWTLANAVDPGSVAGVLLDGAPVGIVFFGLNANGHVVALDFDPEQLAVADITDPAANRFAIGTYALSAASAVPEPTAALVYGAGLLIVAAGLRRR